MNINRLSQEELTYELTIRGLPTGKVEDMRASLRNAIKAEKVNPTSTFVDPYPFTADQDLEALNLKLEEIQGLIGSQMEQGDYLKVLAKSNWAFRRLGKIVTTEASKLKERGRIRAQLVSALASLHTKIRGNEDDSDSCDSGEESSLNTTLLPSNRPRVALYKWKVNFSGEHGGQSLNSFLERILELAEARGVSKTQLFHSVLDLLSGRALIWYRANKSRLSSWADLVCEMRKEFLPSDYDDKLTDEIKRRTQGKDETIGTYIAVMQSLFSRLTTQMTEEQKLKILKKNVTPFYQTQLGLTEVKDIAGLVEVGKKLEAIRNSVESFIPPPSKKNTSLLEPDLAYVSSQMPVIASVSRDSSNTDQSARQKSSLKCNKCGRVGHIARFCRRDIKCYGCGCPGITRPNCEKCKSNRVQGNQSSEPSSAGRASSSSNRNHATPGPSTSSGNEDRVR